MAWSPGIVSRLIIVCLVVCQSVYFFLVYTHTLARLIVNFELTTKSKELFVHCRVILFTICPCSTVHYIRLSLS